ncbi:hypothetical protein ACN9MG_32305 [Burkholderia ambifaria]|uniref:hypothetical protein n=1 Tax=Burkholderia TaxID=32008 RepID=UPI00158E09C7|nr:hypothetical protein [Burkholderia ambifaria]
MEKNAVERSTGPDQLLIVRQQRNPKQPWEECEQKQDGRMPDVSIDGEAGEVVAARRRRRQAA